MQEATGDTFEFYLAAPGSWLVVPTTASRDLEGNLIMPGILARQVKELWPELASELGYQLSMNGGAPVALSKEHIIAWPIRPGWHEPEGAAVHPGWMCPKVDNPQCVTEMGWTINASLPDLAKLVDNLSGAEAVYSPRPGASGGLPWGGVRKQMASLLSDRYIVVS